MSHIPHDILSLQKSHVFIAGDLLLDSYITGKVIRISPEAPVPVIHQLHTKHIPGGAGNTAANIVKFGAKATLCGRIGNDLEAEILKKILKDIGISSDHFIVSSDVPTIQKTRVMTTNQLSTNTQQVVRIDREIIQPLTEEEEALVCEYFLQFCHLDGPRSLILSDYSKGFFSKSLIEKLIQMAKHSEIHIICDPKSFDVARYRGVSVIKPNLSEGRALYHAQYPSSSVFSNFEEEVYRVASCYLEQSCAQNVVMSLSEQGVFSMGNLLEKPVHFQTQALEVADVSGAGDTLIAFLAMGLAVNLPFSENLRFANLAAGIVCSKTGTATVSLSEFMERFSHFTSETQSNKIVSLADLEKITKSLRAQNRTFVFTNGCFDLLHVGHVDYLQKASQLGDVLVVAINSDSSVRKLKGDSRPIQNESDRAQILAALSCVSFVVVFHEETPLHLVEKLKPHVLVKGADYNVETTVGAKEVLSWGGSVEHVQLVEGKSTSRLIQRILDDAVH